LLNFKGILNGGVKMVKKKIIKGKLELEDMKDHYFRLIIFSCILLAIIIIPIFYYLKAHDISELPKITILRILTGFSIIVWGFWLLVRKKKFTIPPRNITFFVLVFLFSWCISTLLSTNFYLSFFGSYMRQLGFFSYFVFFVIFFLLSDIINTEKEIKYFYWGIAITSLIVGIVGVQQFFRLSPWFERVRTESRIISTLGHADFLGHFLVMVIPIILGLLFYVKNIYLKIALFLEFIILFLTLLASYTRGSWIAFIFSFPLFFIFSSWKSPRFFTRENLNKVFTFLIIISIFIEVFSFYHLEKRLYPPNTPLGTFNLQERFSTIGQGLGLTQANPRMLTWRDSINLFKDKILNSPRIIWGLGPETFSFNFTPYKSIDLARYDRGKGYPDREHNEFLDILFPQGILGLFSFLFIILITSITFLKYLNKIPWENRTLVIGTFVGFLGFLIQALVLFGLTATYLYFWTLISFIFIWIRLINENEKLEIDVKRIPIIVKSIIMLICLFVGIFYISISLRFFKAEIFYRYGLDYLAGNDPGKAVSILEEAIKLRPQESAFHEAIIKAYLQIVGGVQKDEEKKFYFNKGEQHIDDLLRNAYYRSLTYNLIGAYYAQGYHYLGEKDKNLIKKAEECLLKALTYDKYSVPPMENLLRLYIADLKDKSKAEEIAKRILDIDPIHYDANMVLASFYFEQKNYNEAKNIYENLSKVYTNNIDIYNNLGITYFQLKDYEKAKNAFLEVLKIDPTNASAKKSIQVISKIIRKPIELPKIPLDKEIEYYMKEGIFYYNQKDYEKAEEYFRKVIKLNNNSAEGYNNLGIVLYMKNKKEEAISMLKKALIINPKYSEAYRNLFYILKDLGRVNEAKEVIITGIRHLPNDESLKRILEELK